MSEIDPFEAYLERTLGEPATQSELLSIDVRFRERLRADRRTRGRRRWLGLALVAAMLLVPTAVAAGLLSVRTTEAPLGMVTAEDFRAEIAAARTGIDLPEGWSWPRYLDIAYPGGSYSRGGGKVAVESAAFCIWTSDWVSARGRQDRSETQRALQTLTASRTWSFYSGPLATDSWREAVGFVIDAAIRGDEGPARAFVMTNCATGA